MAAEQGSEKVACDMAVTDLMPLAAVGCDIDHCGAAGPDATVRRLAWSPDRQKWFGMGLAGERIFHIGNAMKTRFPESHAFGRLGFRKVGLWKARFSEVTVP